MSAEIVSESGRLAGFGLVSAVTLELFGLPFTPIIWGLIGGFLGTGWAKPAGPIASVGVYLCASLISALAGNALAAYYAAGNATAGNVCAAVIGVFFHPILSAVASRIPALVDGLLGMLGKRGAP